MWPSSHDRRSRIGGVATCALQRIPPMRIGEIGERLEHPTWHPIARPGLGLPLVPLSPMGRWYPPGNVRQWWSLWLNPRRVGQATVGIGGVSSKRVDEDARGCPSLAPVPGAEERPGERPDEDSGRVRGERESAREGQREGGMKGEEREREGRFVNAEIGRVAPRREPSPYSQSRCERSKEHHGCFTLPVRCVGDVDVESCARHRQRVLVYSGAAAVHTRVVSGFRAGSTRDEAGLPSRLTSN